jgi:hypothetical protein
MQEILEAMKKFKRYQYERPVEEDQVEDIHSFVYHKISRDELIAIFKFVNANHDINLS